MFVYACVYVCVCVLESEVFSSMQIFTCDSVRVCVCVCVCARARVRAQVHM